MPWHRAGCCPQCRAENQVAAAKVPVRKPDWPLSLVMGMPQSFPSTGGAGPSPALRGSGCSLLPLSRWLSQF